MKRSPGRLMRRTRHRRRHAIPSEVAEATAVNLLVAERDGARVHLTDAERGLLLRLARGDRPTEHDARALRTIAARLSPTPLPSRVAAAGRHPRRED